jgi:hypothetical protein
MSETLDFFLLIEFKIHTFQLKLLSTLSTAAVTEVTKDQIPAKTAHVCGGHITNYYTQTTV